MILIHVVLHARTGRWTLRFEFEQAKCPELHSLGSIGNIFACMHAEYRDSSSKFMISFRVVCSTGSNHDEAKFDEAGRKPGSIVKPG